MDKTLKNGIAKIEIMQEILRISVLTHIDKSLRKIKFGRKAEEHSETCDIPKTKDRQKSHFIASKHLHRIWPNVSTQIYPHLHTD